MDLKDKMENEEMKNGNGQNGHNMSGEKDGDAALRTLLQRAVNTEHAPENLRDRISMMIRE